MKTSTSSAINIWGPPGGGGGGSFNNQTGHHIVRDHVGPLHKIQGYWGHQNVSKCRPHDSGDICTTRESN